MDLMSQDRYGRCVKYSEYNYQLYSSGGKELSGLLKLLIDLCQVDIPLPHL